MADENKLGLITALVMGIGALILLTIVIFVVVGTLDDAELLRSTATTTTATENDAWINGTTYTLTGFDTDNRNYAISSIVNATDGITILEGNYSFSATTGVLTNLTATTWSDVNVTYTYIAPTTYESTTDRLTANFTEGVDNVSGKIPTILLIGAVVLLFGVIVLLVKQSNLLGLGKDEGSL